MSSNEKTALVVLNMGGPDSLAAVEPFLFNLFSDRDLIQLPLGSLLQKPFAKLISHFRSKTVRQNYRAIGGRSPLLEWSTRQAQGIAERLGDDWQAFVAMRYWTPTAEETLEKIHACGIRRAVVLSLYPHYTGATTGSSVKDFEATAKQIFPDLQYTVIAHWYNWPGYLDALAARIREGLAEFPAERRDQVQILFSAHSLPQKFIDRGDPYLEHVTATVRGVMERVGQHPWHLGFQSRSGPVQWMEPETTAVLDRLAGEGHKAVLMVPISFVSDHIETLHEIDIEYREHAEQKGIVDFRRSPSLNDQPDFLTAMAELVKAHLEKNP